MHAEPKLFPSKNLFFARRWLAPQMPHPTTNRSSCTSAAQACTTISTLQPAAHHANTLLIPLQSAHCLDSSHLPSACSQQQRQGSMLIWCSCSLNLIGNVLDAKPRRGKCYGEMDPTTTTAMAVGLPGHGQPRSLRTGGGRRAGGTSPPWPLGPTAIGSRPQTAPAPRGSWQHPRAC